MIRLLLPAAALSVTAALLAAPEPVRSDRDWAIYPQVTAADWEALVQAGDLAAGKLIQAQPVPNYTYAGKDLRSLTDGVLAGAEGRMWTDQRAVGWAYEEFARLTLDLGQSRSLGQLVIRLQVIGKDNTLPTTISVSLSNDGDYYAPVRNLSAKTAPEDNPALTYEPLPTDTPGIYAVVLNLGYQARYVRLDFALHGIMVTDEIALTPATGAVAQLPPPPSGQREYRDNVFDRREQFKRLTAPGNLLLGLPLKYAPQPGYRLTTGASDPTDLTDGQFGPRTDERIWFEQGAVCWQGAPLVSLFADLGRVQPIASVVARFLGGAEQGGLTFPDEIRVLLSNDGDDYYQVSARHQRGLDDRSTEAYELPEVKVAWVHNFVLPVGYRARYLAVQVLHQKQFICSDEIAAVKGPDTLPAFTPAAGKRATIVTRGVAFEPVVVARVPIATMGLRCKLAITDARPGDQYGKPCRLVLDLPETVRMASPGYTPAAVAHQGRPFLRYVIDWRGEGTDFRLQSLLPEGQTDVMYTYGDSGNGPMNERQIIWESIIIPPARLPQRLHMTLAWIGSENMPDTWPTYLQDMKRLGFNGVGFFPRYWTDATKAKGIAVAEEAREMGLAVIQNESPASALSEDWKQPEVHSQFADGKTGDFCPAYRGRYYQKQNASFGQHAVWLRPDYVFYDIEAFWTGAVQEASRCSRCLQRYQQGGFANWDDFRRAMGVEIHRDMRAAIDQALADAGVQLARPIIYGSYRTEPVTELNDGLFKFSDLYPDLLQLAMPSLYVGGSGAAVADNISANRARMTTNDIVPWLTTGCYGEFDPVRTRDMILEALANGARGVTYYWYGDFDAGHFKYHAQAVDLVAPIEDIFVDGRPLTGLKCDDDRIKVCGMDAGGELAVLVSNYRGVPPGTKVTVPTPAKPGTPLWDLHAGKLLGMVGPGGSFTVPLDDIGAHMYYLGSKYAAAVAR